MKKIYAYSLFVLAFLLVFSSCVSGDYVEKDYEKNIQLLKNCAQYSTEAVSIQKQNLIDGERAQEIRSYFKDNTNLDLDALMISEKTTWEKTVELAVFVAKNIPHDNQKIQLGKRNAITLWEYSRNNPKGFNCRYHSILLSELLLSIGIKNSFVTCHPYDQNDGDCHVVNVVWLPELNKWAMIDSDMREYTTDEHGTPLSLQEMRRFIQQDKYYTVNALPGFENSWPGQSYMQAYWAKNLYWFTLYKIYAFDLEYARNPDGTSVFASEYICLVPPDYDVSSSFSNNRKVTNDEVFWAK
ncbi:MAG: hypothetical protein J5857_01115 [Treponema sp.]|nr:hypothetical protein [Treponema sp.]